MVASTFLRPPLSRRRALAKGVVASVGVDRGGTWVRLVAVDEAGHRVRSLKTPSQTLEELPQFLRRQWTAWKTHPKHLTVGSRGVWTSSERGRLQRSLRSLAPHVTVMSDVEGAWWAAFGAARSGVLILSGTGSIALARGRQGRWVRSGGFGPLLGDEGSAFWIGRAWLKAQYGDSASVSLLNLVRSPEAVQRIAALTPRVLRLAQRGQPKARKIIREAQEHLVHLVMEVTQRSNFKIPLHPPFIKGDTGGFIPLSWGGSVLENAWFRRGFLNALRRGGVRGRRRFQIVTPRRDTATAMALYPFYK